MSLTRYVLIGSCGLAILCGQTMAADQKNKKTNTAGQKPSAMQQLKKANQGAQARDHIFDGRKAPPNAVKVNPGRKPSPVGQNIYSRPGNPGFKPGQRLHTNPVPSPAFSRPATQVRSSQPVVRSTTAATAPAKKP